MLIGLCAGEIDVALMTQPKLGRLEMCLGNLLEHL